MAHARGELNGRAVLTRAQRDAIVARHEAGEGIRALARAFGVGVTTVFNVVHGETWEGTPMTGPAIRSDVRERLARADAAVRAIGGRTVERPIERQPGRVLVGSYDPDE